jgi:predicted transcriptional regulator
MARPGSGDHQARYPPRGDRLLLENSLLNTIRRRPLTLEDLAALTAKDENELRRYLDILEKEKKIRPVIQGEKIFYREWPERGPES